MLPYIGEEMFASDKHSSLFGPFVNYEENELLWLQPLPFKNFKPDTLIAVAEIFKNQTEQW